VLSAPWCVVDMDDTNLMEESDQTESMVADQSSVSPVTSPSPESYPSHSTATNSSRFSNHKSSNHRSSIFKIRSMRSGQQVLEHNIRINPDAAELPNRVDNDLPWRSEYQYDAPSPFIEPELYLDRLSTIEQVSGNECYRLPLSHTFSTSGTTEAVRKTPQSRSLLPESTRDDIYLPQLTHSHTARYFGDGVDEGYSRPDSLQQPSHVHLYAGPSQTHTGRKTALIQSGVASGAAIDDRNDTKHHIDLWKDELQTHLHGNAPSSLLFNRDLESRPPRMMLAENGMTDLVISPPDHWNLPWQESQGERERESEIDTHYSSADEPSYYDPRNVQSSVNLMPRPLRRVTAGNLEESNKLRIASNSRWNRFMQMQQINHDSSPERDQQTTFLPASTIDANTVEKKAKEATKFKVYKKSEKSEKNNKGTNGDKGDER